jgi:hypothetical protein
MSLFFKAILVEADPGARWMEPVISGHPRDETPVETPSAKAREPRPLRRHRSS